MNLAEFAGDPGCMMALLMSSYNGVMALQSVMPELSDEENYQEIAGLIVNLKLGAPYVYGVTNGEIQINTTITPLGRWLLKPAWRVSA